MYPFAQGGEKWSRSGTGTDDTATRTDSRQRGIFVTDDKFSDVIRALQRRGWTRSGNANSPNFDLKWRNLSNINFRLLRKHQGGRQKKKEGKRTAVGRSGSAVDPPTPATCIFLLVFERKGVSLVTELFGPSHE
ncbi:conserved unknown protein [Ectocarpus siliculosus]|uniref:Uncharacterized protein n=1 Tax=Ectocarpus siliculosus TaxID=2880 RepID=D7FQ43_ECTSI|nr:conserved unknown protein [Ectocarpus siliculosus]|eukprot:CBJ48375.1 conserved unknown protein [Ectocarpus siliculosus]